MCPEGNYKSIVIIFKYSFILFEFRIDIMSPQTTDISFQFPPPFIWIYHLDFQNRSKDIFGKKKWLCLKISFILGLVLCKRIGLLKTFLGQIQINRISFSICVIQFLLLNDDVPKCEILSKNYNQDDHLIPTLIVFIFSFFQILFSSYQLYYRFNHFDLTK